MNNNICNFNLISIFNLLSLQELLGFTSQQNKNAETHHQKGAKSLSE